MFPRIDNFIEEWAMKYKPIQHDPTRGSKKRRFFRFDSLDAALDVTKQFTTFSTPVAGIVTQFDGVSHGRLMELEVVAFAFTKQGASQSDTGKSELAAAEAKAMGAEICNDLWVWLMEQKRLTPKNPQEELYWLHGMDLDNVAILTYPVFLNGWWATSLELKVEVPRQTCVDKGKYL